VRRQPCPKVSSTAFIEAYRHALDAFLNLMIEVATGGQNASSAV